jgi:hypothetical protein
VNAPALAAVRPADRTLSLAVAAIAAITGGAVAAHHPAAPGIAVAAFVAMAITFWRWPLLWLAALPAVLPAASLAPWTGWIAVDEFDLAVLAALAGGYARRAQERSDAHDTSRAGDARSRRLFLLASLCAVTHVAAVVHGATASGVPTFAWFDGYVDPINAVRVGKSEVFALLLVPLVATAMRRSRGAAMRHLEHGMLIGAAVVAVAVGWERATQPGLLDFSSPYRTVALFWEMHVGGAAIDAYLAMAVPFVAWAVLRARTPAGFAAAATLALVAEYACLTTFARGVYLAVAGGLLVVAVLAWRSRPVPAGPRWRRRAGALLVVAMTLEVAAVFGSDSFMLARLTQSHRDFVGRLQHWREGASVLDGPSAWALGIGVGRFPAAHAAAVPARAFPGEARVVEDHAGEAWLRLRGPSRADAPSGRFAVTQRVLAPGEALQVTFDVRSDRPERIETSLCRAHLLYERDCRRASIVVPAGGDWQHAALRLAGEREGDGESAGDGEDDATRGARTFSLRLLDAGGATVAIDNVAVTGGAATTNLLRNGDFSRGAAHWFPAARDAYVPWHVDNLALELLIEEGMVGLATFSLVMLLAFATLLGRGARDAPAPTEAPCLAGALTGALLVGLVSSVLDMPRVAFLLFLLAFVAIALGSAPRRDDTP